MKLIVSIETRFIFNLPVETIWLINQQFDCPSIGVAIDQPFVLLVHFSSHFNGKILVMVIRLIYQTEFKSKLLIKSTWSSFMIKFIN